jgi:hypothetical protein
MHGLSQRLSDDLQSGFAPAIRRRVAFFLFEFRAARALGEVIR